MSAPDEVRQLAANRIGFLATTVAQNSTSYTWRMNMPARSVPAFAHLLRLRALMVFVISVWQIANAHADGAAKPVPDTLQQRIAMCTACHGPQGEGTPETGFFPRLAGKPADYLLRELSYFQQGLRSYAPMEYAVRGLSPDYLREIAAYFAARSVPYVRSPVPALPPVAMQRGEVLVTQGDAARGVPACQACHGQQLTGVEPSIPALVGLPYDYLSSQLGSWRTGTRAMAAPDCMAQIASRLAPADITAVAAWLATREPPAGMHAQAAGTVSPPLKCGVLAASAADASATKESTP